MASPSARSGQDSETRGGSIAFAVLGLDSPILSGERFMGPPKQVPTALAMTLEKAPVERSAPYTGSVCRPVGVGGQLEGPEDRGGHQVPSKKTAEKAGVGHELPRDCLLHPLGQWHTLNSLSSLSPGQWLGEIPQGLMEQQWGQSARRASWKEGSGRGTFPLLSQHSQMPQCRGAGDPGRKHQICSSATIWAGCY